MATNDKQKIILLDISASTVNQIEEKLQEGFVIQKIITLLPKYEKLLIVYATPDII